MRIIIGRGKNRRNVDVVTGSHAHGGELARDIANLTTYLLNVGIIARSAA